MAPRTDPTESGYSESEEKYRLLVDSLPHAIGIVQDKMVVFANHTMLEMLQLPSVEAAREVNLLDYVVPESRELMAERMRRRLTGENLSPASYLMELQRIDGSVLQAEMYAQTIQYRGRPAAQFVAIDITERLRLEEQLRHTQKMEAVGTLASGIAHDFNNILTSVLGMASLLRHRSGLDPEVHREVGLIESAAEQAAALTRQLLDFASRRSPSFEPSDMHQITSGVCEILFRSIDKKIIPSFRPMADHAIVNGDPSQLQQVVMNLAVNAQDAMPTGGELTIETSNVEITGDARTEEPDLEAGNYLVVSVSDTGKGIPGNLRDRIFEPFFTTKAVGEGTGMGLAVVYGIVKKHGGTVGFESREQGGTTFRLTLPLMSNAKVGDDREATIDLRVSGVVLLVDDKEIVRETVTEMLTSLGCEVQTASSGRQALDLYRCGGESIDLVLLDVGMPEMSGVECLYKLREIDPGVRILLSSGASIDPAVRKLIDNQEIGFIDKPYSLTGLASAVGRQLKRK